MSKPNFEIISFSEISSNKQIVISRNTEGNDDLIIAQRMVVFDSGRERHFYEKGTIIVKSEFEEAFCEMLEKLLEKLKK